MSFRLGFDPSRVVKLVLAAGLVPVLVTIGEYPAAGAGLPACMGRIATIVGTVADERIVGTDEADTIVGLGGQDIIDGLAGDDRICAGRGDDIINGGAGNDEMVAPTAMTSSPGRTATTGCSVVLATMS